MECSPCSGGTQGALGMLSGMIAKLMEGGMLAPQPIDNPVRIASMQAQGKGQHIDVTC